jgi:hypothetical protein
MDPNNLLQRVILPALNVCGICSKQESEHGQANHKYERNAILSCGTVGMHSDVGLLLICTG